MKGKMKKCSGIWKTLCFLLPLFVSASAGAAVSSPSEDGSTVKEIFLPPDGKITGYVFDVNGEPLPDVNVAVRGTTIGVVTDVNGFFTLDVPAGATLDVSYIGYVRKSVAAKDNLRITLEEDAEMLDEVVVVGYGTMKKSDLTGAVSSVTPKSFLDQPGSSVNSILQGRAPGVMVRRTNGTPGGGSTIRIRGVNSILGNNDPLVVVDGNYGDMPSVYDIESIEVLKDASATAIYGSRGANGVIIVTTKRGAVEGRNEVKLYSNVSFDQVANRYDMMEAAEYAEFMNAANESIGVTPLYTAADIARFREQGGTDWQSELFRTGMTQSHKAVLTGGNKKMKYYISPSYSNTDGIIINSSSKSYGLGAKFDAEVSSRISYQVEASVSHGETLNPELGSGTDHMGLPLYAALIAAPTSPILNDDGSYHMDPLSSRMSNPILMTTLKDTRYSNSGGAVGNLKIKIIDGLVFDGKASISFGTGGNRSFTPAELNGNRAEAYQKSYENKSWLVNAVLTYSKTIAEKHQLSLMLGFEQNQGMSRSFSASANDLYIPSVEWDNLGLGRSYGAESGYSNDAMRSYFTRGTYNYDGRYYFTGTYRADGSSKFRGKNLFSYFPSFAVSWRLSEEGFLKDADIFRNLKLRGSWGITGSQAVDSYATNPAMDGSSYAWGTSQSNAGYRPNVMGNPDLQWEETTTTDFGADLSVLDGKLSLSLDYYCKLTDKLLSQVAVPLYNGGGTISSNIGEIENKGFEANLNFVVFESNDWSYDVNLNGAHNKNTVLDIGEQDRLWGGSSVAGPMDQSPFIILPGHSIGTIYGHKYLGLWQQGDVVEAAKYGQAPGDYRYEDLNGNYSYDAEDYQIIGNSTPDFTWGFNNHLAWKNWNLNILFEGLHGRDILNLGYCAVNNVFDNSLSITARTGKDRWTRENPWAEFSKLSVENVVKANSDQWIQDGSYVKLRNLSLAYRFTKQQTKFADIRVSLSAQNVLTFTKYKGYDPEVSSAGGSDTDAGLDWFAYPNPRSYTLSFSLEY
jgi:TonB-linked SusC/RagA family outer membrane protein